MHVRQFLEVPMYLYGELSSKFDEFLAVRSQFDSDNGVAFPAPTCCDGIVQDTIRVETVFIIQAKLPIRQTDTFITRGSIGVYATLGDPV